MRLQKAAFCAFLSASCAFADDFAVAFREDGQIFFENPPETQFNAAERQLSEGSYDSLADLILKAAQGFTQVAFETPSLQFQRAVTSREAIGDVLLAEWTIQEPYGKGSVVLRDTPNYSTYSLRLDGTNIVSRADLTEFLSGLLVWDAKPGKKPLGITPKNLEIRMNADCPEITSFQVVSLAPMRQFDLPLPIRIDATEVGDAWFVTVEIFKRSVAPYYPVAPFVQERFPPLLELVKTWSISKILGEVGKPTGTIPQGYGQFEERDRILVAELANRPEFTKDDTLRLLDVSANALETRLDVVWRGFSDAGKMTRFAGDVLRGHPPLLQRYGIEGRGSGFEPFGLPQRPPLQGRDRRRSLGPSQRR